MFDQTTEQKALVRAAAQFCAEHAELMKSIDGTANVQKMVISSQLQGGGTR